MHSRDGRPLSTFMFKYPRRLSFAALIIQPHRKMLKCMGGPTDLHEALQVLLMAGRIPGVPAAAGSAGLLLQFHGHALELPRPLLSAHLPPPPLLLITLPHLHRDPTASSESAPWPQCVYPHTNQAGACPYKRHQQRETVQGSHNLQVQVKWHYSPADVTETSC